MGSDRHDDGPSPSEEPSLPRERPLISAKEIAYPFESISLHLDAPWSDQLLLQGLVADSPLALSVVDADGVVQIWNLASERLYGWTGPEVIGRPSRVVGADFENEADEFRRRALGGRRVLNVETIREHRTGRPIEVLVSITPLADRVGTIRGVLEISQVITARKTESDLQRQIRIDALTGFDSRSWFFERVTALLATTRTSAGFVRLEIIDLQAIDDTYGHSAGDEVAGLFTDRMRGVLRDSDLVARLGANEFALFIADVNVGGITAVVERILATLDLAFVVAGESVMVRACAGGLSCSASDRISDLIWATDVALGEARQRGEGGLSLYDAVLHAPISEQIKLEADLGSAALPREMTMHYQLVIDTDTVVISGVEAFVCWEHPILGLLLPAQFISAVEATGDIPALGSWALHEACAQAARWRDQFPDLSPFTMSINLTPQQLRDPEFVGDVAAVLGESGLAPDQLELEIEESVLANDTTLTTLLELRDLGVRLAIDNFGTGGSSLAALRRFPFTTLKIDRSFVAGIAMSDEDRYIVLSTITLAEHLGLTSIAVGVETGEQLDFLTYHGCDKVQGPLFCHPLPASETEELLRTPTWSPL
jgi:diguanylate cyclase (GGDEF)-like protein/PAS domain S-box-containing protein